MSDAVIRLSQVSKVYGEGEAATAALRDVSLTIERGSWTAVMGPSGHGKSTLRQLMGGLDRPTAGENPRRGGQPRRTQRGQGSRACALARSGRVPVLQPAAAPDGRRERRDRHVVRPCRGETPGAAAQFGTARTVRLERQGESPSRDAFAIARALANEPDVLLLDEPTGNLDSTAETEFLDLLRELHGQGRTLVMVTHSPAVAARAERLVKVKDGRIEAGG